MSLMSIRKNVLSKYFLSLLMIALNGCGYLAVAGVGAVGGYVISPDTVEGVINGHGVEDVWDGTIETISNMGIIEEQNQLANTVTARIHGAKVNITLISVNDSATKLRLRARKWWMPRIHIAQDIYIKIINYMNN